MKCTIFKDYRKANFILGSNKIPNVCQIDNIFFFFFYGSQIDNSITLLKCIFPLNQCTSLTMKYYAFINGFYIGTIIKVFTVAKQN